MPQIPTGNDDGQDDLAAALVFSSTGGSDDDGLGESAFGALHSYAPTEPEVTTTELDAVRAQTEVAEESEEHQPYAGPLFTVINAPQTVSVTALIDGSPHEIDLLAEVTSMTESQLAQEILVLADLARQKGLAGQHTYLSENLRVMGADEVPLDGYLEDFMGLSSPEKAAAAQAEVFANRYQ